MCPAADILSGHRLITLNLIGDALQLFQFIGGGRAALSRPQARFDQEGTEESAVVGLWVTFSFTHG